MEKFHNPLVSVITSFFNEEKFLRETVESVLSQSYTNWEMILIDDGSKDGSTLIAQEFARNYPEKIIYTDHNKHINRGLSASRNHGILASKGELIAILDADDVWLKEKLQLQVDILNGNPDVGMLCEASQYWHSWDNTLKDDVIIQMGCESDRKFNPPELLNALYPLSTGAAPCPSGIMFRKDTFLNCGGFEEHFTGKFQLYEDQAFLHKVYLHEVVFVSSFCNNKYRQRTGSLVQKITHDGKYHEVRKYFLEWLRVYLKENDLETKQISKLVDKAFKPYTKATNLFSLLATALKKRK
jgi:glycosyltransferase involved in cell wall biosynthesis